MSRSTLKLLAAFVGLTAATGLFGNTEVSAENIGSRRELFVDDALVDRLTGGAQLRLQHPVARERVIVHDAPWEGAGSAYHSIFQDGGKYRMYYKAWHMTLSPGTATGNRHPLSCCYAESTDGINWTKPQLGMVPFEGSTANNIVMASGAYGKCQNVDAGHPAVFLDTNPAAPRDARYKAFLRVRDPGKTGLMPFKSADGIHWQPMTDGPVITNGRFDSQNTGFWDAERNEYRAYWRYFAEEKADERNPQGLRSIRTAASTDFINWEREEDLTFSSAAPEQLYTNAIKPYHRAPHLVIGFPMRYVDRGPSKLLAELPDREHRQMRANATPRYGQAVSDTLFVAGRDRVKFKKWAEAFIAPGPERPGTWNYGHQVTAWHVVETTSHLPGAPNELSLYAVEDYWVGRGSALRRYTLRLDGFVAAEAAGSEGALETKPIRFDGNCLQLNYSTAAAGSLRVEILDPSGNPIPGFSLADCDELFGDSVERRVTWKGSADVSALAGKPVRLRFVLREASLYAYQFGP